ncbi:SpoIIE family protein phosphatase [Streptomyces sp. RKAG290]|uniref:SpoIIE family protein phosphatase n=1 Tax=Streptomyces sp. RKAG290 TaxID=2888348 RepID=UPI00203381B0|nr:SpoIIE family protein phosphatase [Streptomyces sp. RKAG290]MCM2416315.1 SpoIIE family protein phosphatase [Streptomyces sp. RKAG290]
MASDVALLVVDVSGTVLEWTQGAEEAFGRTASQALGRPAWELLPATARPDAENLWARIGGAEAEGLMLRPVVRGDGSSAWGVYRAASGEGDDPLGKALLRALFTLSPIGMQVVDPDLRILRVNTAAGGIRGIPAERLVGRRLDEAFRVTSPEATTAMVREVLATGEPAIDRIVGANPPSDQDREHLYEVSVFPLHDSDRQVLGVASSVVDVTERERALSRTRILNAVREHVGRTLEMDTTCTDLVRVLVPAFADEAEVHLLDPVIRGDEPPSAPVAPDVPLRRMGFASTERLPSSEDPDLGPLRFPTAWSQSLTDLQPHLIVHSPPQAPGAPQAHSAIITPLTLRGGVLGTLSLHRSTERPVFEQRDLDLALDLAARTALHIDNARRYTREHTIALTLQRHLLPQSTPVRAALETAHFLRPGAVGGGWFDVIPLSGARVAFTVGRVAGQGIQATTAMGQIRTAIHTLSSLDLECDELLARLNDTVARLATERSALDPGHTPPEAELTAGCVYGIYDPLSHSCTVALAGHPPPLLAHPGGATAIPDFPQAPSLGTGTDGAVFASTCFDLTEGSIIGLHTDTFLPPEDPRTGARREELREVLADTGRSLDAMCEEAVRKAAPEGHATDAILLLIRAHALEADRVARRDLPADPAAVATARAWARRQLADWRLDELTFGTELIVSELATNAIRYGKLPFELRLINGPALTCEVRDSSLVAPHLRHAQATEEGGRGLFICAELAHRWGARFTSEGKTIWTEQEMPPSNQSAQV